MIFESHASCPFVTREKHRATNIALCALSISRTASGERRIFVLILVNKRDQSPFRIGHKGDRGQPVETMSSGPAISHFERQEPSCRIQDRTVIVFINLIGKNEAWPWTLR
jgi:hypothetical protein